MPDRLTLKGEYKPNPSGGALFHRHPEREQSPMVVTHVEPDGSVRGLVLDPLFHVGDSRTGFIKHCSKKEQDTYHFTDE